MANTKKAAAMLAAATIKSTHTSTPPVVYVVQKRNRKAIPTGERHLTAVKVTLIGYNVKTLCGKKFARADDRNKNAGTECCEICEVMRHKHGAQVAQGNNWTLHTV